MRISLLVYTVTITITLIASTLRVSSFVFRHPAPRCGFSPSSFTFNTPRWSSSEASEDDIKRWEKMFQGGEASTNTDKIRNYFASELRTSEVRVVTFDLDNTLWKTGPTILAANDAMAVFLEKEKITLPKRIEKVMGDLFQASKSRYAPLSDDAKAPTLLTVLRKDAVQYVLEEYNNYTMEESIEFSDKAFDVWINARYESITSHFAKGVVPCLERIRRLSSSTGNPVVIGAITDGNSDPRQVPVLNTYFDFVVNAEGVGISKPDKRVYVAAMTHVATHPSCQDIFGPVQDTLTPEVVENTVGPWWVHIGDDFTKDIVAAKDLNMRNIWSRELILDDMLEGGNKKAAAAKDDRSVEDLVQELSKMTEIKMGIGAEDYLATSLQQEFADSIVDEFMLVSQVLTDWHEQGLQSKKRRAEETENATVDDTPGDATPNITPAAAAYLEATDSVLSVVIPDGDSAEADASTAEPTKFCMFCGKKVMLAAKFCSTCGEKQPEIN